MHKFIKLNALFLLTAILLFAQTHTLNATAKKEGVVAGKLGEQMDKYFSTIAQLGFSGSVLIAKNGEVILRRGYGYADTSRSVPVTTETVFDIGSITKQFTAAAIMKLEMQGKLDTNDLMSKYLPDVPEDKKTVTLHHLLTHTAGLSAYSGQDYETSPRDETVKRILSAKLQSEPGKEYSYSNSGFSLLAAIVERVSGQAWETFVHKNLFEPAGMQMTGYRLAKWNRQQLARGYNGERDTGTPLDHNWAASGPYWNLFGNGGILSTPSDLYKWAQALKGEKILSAAAKQKLFKPFLNNYAYGWTVEESPHGKRIAHGGGSDYGFLAHLSMYPDKDTFIIITSNTIPFEDFAYMQVLVNRVMSMVFSAAVPEHPSIKPTKISPAHLKAFAGTYNLPSGERFIVTQYGNRLLIEAEGQGAVNVMGLRGGMDASAHQNLNSRSAAVAEGALKENYDALNAAVGDEARSERYRRTLTRWREAWQKENGAILGHEILGTVQNWWSAGDTALVTFVRVRLERGQRLLRFHWREGKIVAVGGEGIRNPAPTPFIAQSKDDFAGYHVGLAIPLRASFNVTKSGEVTALTIRGRGEAVTATKSK